MRHSIATVFLRPMIWRSPFDRLWLPSCIALLILASSATARETRYQANGPKFNPLAENWVREQLKKGPEADLAIFDTNEENRKIRAIFLFNLLVNPPAEINVPHTFIGISNAIVVGDLSLNYMKVPFTLSLNRCHFLGNVSIQGTTFQAEVSLYDAVFDKSVDFLRSHVLMTLELDNAKFTSKNEPVSFAEMRVEGPFLIRKAVFEGDASFIRAAANGFDASGAHFNSSNDKADFYGMKINQDAAFVETQFKGAVSFANTDIEKDLLVDLSRFENPLATPDFFSAKVGGNATFWRTYFAGGVRLTRMNIGGNLEFGRAVADSVTMEKDFSTLKADDIIFNDAFIAPPFFLNGMSYRLIFDLASDQGKPAQRDVLLDLINRSNYRTENPDNYTNLETFYLKQGNIEGAKDAHIEWRKRERYALGFKRHPLKYGWNIIEWITTGYGQRLELALLWSGGFIVLGVFVFRREEWMETKEQSEAKTFKNTYHPLWYSIALFLPVVSLEDKDIWIPKADRRKSRVYMRLHIILGYLLIPIGLAAWTGLIK